MTTQLEQDVALAKELGFLDCAGSYLSRESQIHAICNAIREQAVPQWISVEDRLPEDGVNVLARGLNHRGIRHCVAGIFNGIWKSQETEDENKFEVFHWMPLPAAPTREDR